jgi:hypothetical protein
MRLISHPEWLRPELEETYQVLIKYSIEGKVFGTLRVLIRDLRLRSPAPLQCRLKALAKLGVIQFG